jgi:DNA mismatch repair protein, C-terminal domain
VTNLFEGLPVRKQSVLKESAKTFHKIHKLLQAYALAKTSIRFSFKVIKAKSLNQNFTYAPKVGTSSVQDAALKILNRDCVSQCLWVTQVIDEYEFRALLPRSQCDVSKISNGQYIAVDERPVSHTRGALKQFCIIFKETLKKHDVKFNDVKYPFICLNVICPPGTYDINIEPAKDDILFTEQSTVLTAIEKFFVSIYPEVREPTTQSDVEDILRSTPASEVDITSDQLEDLTSMATNMISSNALARSRSSYGMNMPAKQPDSGDMAFQSGPHHQDIERVEIHQDGIPRAYSASTSYQESDIRSMARPWASSMYEFGEDEPHFAGDTTEKLLEDIEDLQGIQNDVHISNPWVFARMTAKTRPRMCINHSEGMIYAENHVLEPSRNRPTHTAALPLQIRSGPVISQLAELPKHLTEGDVSRQHEESRDSSSTCPSDSVISFRKLPSLSSPSSLLNRPFKPPNEKVERSRRNLRQHEHGNIAVGVKDSQDIRKFFSSNSRAPKSQSRRNLASCISTRHIEEVKKAISCTSSSKRAPEASQRSTSDISNLQSSPLPYDQITAHQYDPSLSEVGDSDDVSSLNIANFFRSSQLTPTSPVSSPASFLMSLNRPFLANLPLEVIPLEARTQNLVKRVTVSPAEIRRGSHIEGLHLMPFRPLPVNITDYEIPLAHVLSTDGNTFKRWASEVAKAFRGTIPNVQPARDLELLIMENMQKARLTDGVSSIC